MDGTLLDSPSKANINGRSPLSFSYLILIHSSSILKPPARRLLLLSARTAGGCVAVECGPGGGLRGVGHALAHGLVLHGARHELGLRLRHRGTRRPVNAVNLEQRGTEDVSLLVLLQVKVRVGQGRFHDFRIFNHNECVNCKILMFYAVAELRTLVIG